MKKKLYTGASKTLYETEEEFTLIMSFNDSLRLPRQEVMEFSGKGVLNNSISSFLMQKLDLIGVETHFVEKVNMRQQLIQFVEIFPVQVLVSSLSCGRYVTDFGLENGFVFESPILDFRVKNFELNYPPINENQIISFGWLVDSELTELKKLALQVNDFLTGFFAALGIRLVEVKLEFGRVFNGEESFIMLTDELSPDNCVLWDMSSNELLSSEIAATHPEQLIPAYQEILRRLKLQNDL